MFLGLFASENSSTVFLGMKSESTTALDKRSQQHVCAQEALTHSEMPVELKLPRCTTTSLCPYFTFVWTWCDKYPYVVLGQCDGYTLF